MLETINEPLERTSDLCKSCQGAKALAVLRTAMPFGQLFATFNLLVEPEIVLAAFLRERVMIMHDHPTDMEAG